MDGSGSRFRSGFVQIKTNLDPKAQKLPDPMDPDPESQYSLSYMKNVHSCIDFQCRNFANPF
jgi:hypothetical protein